MGKRLYIAISGLIVSFVGIMTVVGYAIGVPLLYQWSAGCGYMAMNTAICLMLIGWALVTVAFMKNRE